jgi:ribosomal-protein-alanine N-acetyltransferase
VTASEGSFPELATERLVLRKITVEDARALYAFRSDPVGQRFNGGAMAIPAEAIRLIGELDSGFEERSKIHWGVTVAEEGIVIGLFGFANWSHEHRRAEIGFSLHRDYWGRGLGLEAARVLLEYGFGAMDLNRIHACCWVENLHSVALLERLGFSREGTLREEFFADGCFHDEAHYALLRTEYLSGHS